MVLWKKRSSTVVRGASWLNGPSQRPHFAIRMSIESYDWIGWTGKTVHRPSSHHFWLGVEAFFVAVLFCVCLHSHLRSAHPARFASWISPEIQGSWCYRIIAKYVSCEFDRLKLVDIHLCKLRDTSRFMEKTSIERFLAQIEIVTLSNFRSDSQPLHV